MRVEEHQKIHEYIGTASEFELGICPNCGTRLESEQYGKLFMLYCPNGDFISDIGLMSQCIAEALSGLRWRKRGLI